MNGYGVRLAKVIASLTDCLCETVAVHGGGPTCWCGFYPGSQPSWDGCGECDRDNCGMAYVVLESVFPSDSLPNQALTNQTCASPLAATFKVGVLRCVPVADEDGSMPDEGAMLEAGLAIAADATAMWSVVACCVEDVFVGQYTALGPQGGCAGGEWTVTVAL